MESRLDWRVLVVHGITFRQARAVLSSAGPLAAIVALQGRLDGPRLIVIAVLVAVGSLAGAALRWWRFGYVLDAERLIVRQGVFSRSERTVPLDRIRGVDVEASVLHRLFGLAVVRVDAAAGAAGGDEAVLDAVARRDVDALRGQLLSRRATNPSPAAVPADTPPAPGSERELARLDPRWLLYAPLVGGYLAVPVALGGTLLREVDGVPLPRRLRDLLDLRPGDGVGVGNWLAAGAVAVAVVVLGALLAGAIANWGFRLVEHDGTLVARRGLLTTRTVSLEADRVRGYVLSAGLGIRLVGAARLTALVTGLGDETRRGQLLPLGPLRVARAVARDAVGPAPGPLRRHPPAARRRRLLRALLAPAAVVALVAVALPGWPTVLAAAVLVPLGAALGWDRFRALGHTADRAAVRLRSGALLRREVVLQRRAVVGYRLRRSYFQRRAGLATLTVAVGAGEGGYDVLDCGVGQALDLMGQVSPTWTGGLTGFPPALLSPPGTHSRA